LGDAFSLTLTLSRWEKELALSGCLKLVTQGAKDRRVSPETGRIFAGEKNL
jgi:hypothetical protein